MSTRVWLGLDVGTSSLKMLAVDENGRALAQSEQPLRIDHPHPDRAEADPTMWLTAVDAALNSVPQSFDVQGLGVTGQMHSTVLVGEAGAVRPAVLWPDARAVAMRRLWDGLPAEALRRLGNPWAPGMTGPVLSWLVEQDPRAVAQAERVVLPKDLVRAHLVPGSWATDPSDASGTLLYDVGRGTWSPEASALVPAELLPEICASTEIAGNWGGVPVAVGGGDTPTSLLPLVEAIGDWQSGDVVVNLGTGAQVIDPVAGRPVGSGWSEVHVYADTQGGTYAMVPAQNAGLALTWARQQLDLTWDRFAALCQQAPAGAAGTIFSPFMMVERGPVVPRRPHLGWTGDTAAALAARSAAEAQAFLVRRCVEILPGQVRRIFVVGGGARDLWVRQLLADVLNVVVRHVPMRSAAAAGAVMLVGGPALNEPAAATSTTVCEPRPSPALEQAYERWRRAHYG